MALASAIALSPVGLATAFAAGVASFVSPCVAPLLPAYLSFVSGVGHEDLPTNARRVSAATAMFVLGFGLVFTAFGAGAGFASGTLSAHRRGIEIAGGVLVILMGLALVGFASRLFGRELRYHPRARPVSALGATAAGMAFAIGWTPCVGPILAAILTVAGQTGGAGDGAALLAAYSLGLGLPFLAAGLAFSSTMTVLGVFRRHGAMVNRIAGLTMVAAGLLLASGELSQISARLGS